MIMDTNFSKIKENLQCFNRPIYETVILSIIQMIESGELPPGTKFPPDKKLAIELGINHITLAKALNELRRRNVLDRRRATGTFVPENRQLAPASPARKKIAVVFDNVSDETFQQNLFIQLCLGLENLNCSLCFFSCNNDPAKQFTTVSEILDDFSISGCLVWSILSQDEAVKLIRKRPRYYPLIFMDKYYEGVDHDAVTYPDFATAAAIARSLNRRKITSCCWVEEQGKSGFSSVRDRREGFISAWKKENRFETMLISPELSAEKFSLPPDDHALVCADSVVARRLKELMIDSGTPFRKNMFVIESPEDDHSLIREFTAYKFLPGIGEEAVKILASRLNGKECCTVNHSGKWSVLAARKTTEKNKEKKDA